MKQRVQARSTQAATVAEEKQSNDEGHEVEKDDLQIKFIGPPGDENTDWRFQTEWDAFVSW
jgi:hypothetical protein